MTRQRQRHFRYVDVKRSSSGPGIQWSSCSATGIVYTSFILTACRFERSEKPSSTVKKISQSLALLRNDKIR